MSKEVGPHMEKRMTTDKMGLEHKSFAFGHDSKQTSCNSGWLSIIVNVQYMYPMIYRLGFYRLALDRSTPMLR